MINKLILILFVIYGLSANAQETNSRVQEIHQEIVEKLKTRAIQRASVITGFTLPVASSTIISDPVTLQVEPAAKAATAQLVVAGENRVDIKNVVRNPEAGTIVFQVSGKRATPTNKPRGDTKVVARDGENDLAQANVIVVIPSAIATPHPEASGAVTPVNMAVDKTTSPAWFNARNNRVKLLTFFGHYLEITVDDQFGNVLNKVYEGTPVSETISGNTYPMNQNITSTGTYIDPVFVFRKHSNVDKMIPDPANPSRKIENPAINTFLTGATLPFIVHSEIQNIGVEVGGHVLNPGIVMRKLESKLPDIVEITWP